jgi:hypothetical protein
VALAVDDGTALADTVIRGDIEVDGEPGADREVDAEGDLCDEGVPSGVREDEALVDGVPRAVFVSDGDGETDGDAVALATEDAERVCEVVKVAVIVGDTVKDVAEVPVAVVAEDADALVPADAVSDAPAVTVPPAVSVPRGEAVTMGVDDAPTDAVSADDALANAETLRHPDRDARELLEVLGDGTDVPEFDTDGLADTAGVALAAADSDSVPLVLGLDVIEIDDAPDGEADADNEARAVADDDGDTRALPEAQLLRVVRADDEDDGVSFGEIDVHAVVDALPVADDAAVKLLAVDSDAAEEAVATPLDDAAEVPVARPDAVTPGVGDTIGLPLSTGDTLAAALAESGAVCEFAADADGSKVTLVETVVETSGLAVGDVDGGDVRVTSGVAEMIGEGVESEVGLAHGLAAKDADTEAESVEADDALA